MCSIDDCDERYEPYSRTRHKAARRYTCEECGTPIHHGDRYERAAGCYDGHWNTHRICIACAEGPCDWLARECGGFLHGGVQEDLEEHWDEYRHAPIDERMVLGRLIISMRRRRKAAQHRFVVGS